jgi:phosphatidylserine/phosphatidylglycerophosphate/cardiolipin synthase-like enzyme
LRHPGRPELDVAYVGGIDLCHSRRDDASHLGDPQTQPMSAVYGPQPPWHDIQVAIRGPAVGDVETVFRERWNDPAPLSRDPLRRLRDRLQGFDAGRRTLPDQMPDPPPCGRSVVQLLRTYPARRHGYPFAPEGERSVARAMAKVLGRARQLIYLEDQYLWSREVAAEFCQALRGQPELRLIAVLPQHPDQDGRFSKPPNLIGRYQALHMLRQAGGDRVAVYGLENHQGTPIYVHAKVCIIDDTWASVGSDNFNRRSWSHDSELSCAVIDQDADTTHASVESPSPTHSYARQLRLTLAREHLDWADDDTCLSDPRSAFDAFASTAAALDTWYTNGQKTPRPAGRLRTYQTPQLSPVTTAWATPLYRAIYDPDGRPHAMRRTGRF